MHLICPLLCASTGPFAALPFHLAGRVDAIATRQKKQRAGSIAEQSHVSHTLGCVYWPFGRASHSMLRDDHTMCATLYECVISHTARGMHTGARVFSVTLVSHPRTITTFFCGKARDILSALTPPMAPRHMLISATLAGTRLVRRVPGVELQGLQCLNCLCVWSW